LACLQADRASGPAGEGLVIAQAEKYEGHDWWKWSVWLEGSKGLLSEVESVTWHLHPTFPKPVQKLTNQEQSFRLDSSGWGTFWIRAEVVFQDGRVA
jgi:transcription initiation factor IIF auxiliary subunit